jgi:hypothetical protein
MIFESLIHQCEQEAPEALITGNAGESDLSGERNQSAVTFHGLAF